MAGGRYKSRLLNTLVDQAQKVQARTARGWRQVRTGVVWGAQILLYPLYVAFQASRVVGRQMGTAARAPRQLIQPPEAVPVDTPLKKVLELAQRLADGGAISAGAISAGAIPKEDVAAGVATMARRALAAAERDPADGWELEGPKALEPDALEPKALDLDVCKLEAAQPEAFDRPTHAQSALAEPTPTEPTASSTYIRGVASSLGNRALVLVDNQNRLVPLTSEQQWELQQNIVTEVAAFAYQRRQALRYHSQRQQPLPPPKGDRPTLFPVVRWCQDLMGWMQRSPVALGANLFSEMQLPPGEIAAPALPFADWSPEQRREFALAALASLDAPLSSLEETYVDRVDTRQLGGLIRRAAAFFGLIQPRAIEADEPSFNAFNANPSRFNESNPSAQDALSPRSNPPTRAFPSTPPRRGLFGRATPAALKAAAPNALPSPPSTAPSNPRSALTTSPPSVLAVSTTTSTAVPSTVAPSPSSLAKGARLEQPTRRDDPTRPHNPASLAEQFIGQPSRPTPERLTERPSYIETKATVTGYIKHPLEWVLETLDRLLLWCEQTTVGVWDWLKVQFQGDR